MSRKEISPRAQVENRKEPITRTTSGNCKTVLRVSLEYLEFDFGEGGER